MKISFLTSGHGPYDDRIFHHLGMTLSENGHIVSIISSKLEKTEVSGNISIDSFNDEKLTRREKIIAFREHLERFNPEKVICSEPLPVIAAMLYRKKYRNLRIFYDVTEWYPSVRFLKECNPVLRWFGFIKLLLINLFASFAADAFIFGERRKSSPYRLLFPFKPYRIISYYPNLKYVNYKIPSFSGNKLRLSYSGEISIQKGFGSFMKVVNSIAALHRDLKIEIKMVSWYESERGRKECEALIGTAGKNVVFSNAGRQDLTAFTGQINESDIFLDLRKVNFENNHSLPIKLFYYAALGRPVIISDLKSLHGEVKIEKFGFAVDPGDTMSITKIFSDYFNNPALYQEHCNNARKLAEEEYNWGKISPEFLSFIEAF